MVFLAATGLWKSPLSIGLKLKCGNATRNDALILDASDQLLRFRSGDSTALVQASRLKLQIAERQIAEATRVVDRMIAEGQEDPSLHVARSKILVMTGHPAMALNELRKARELSLAGTWCGEFTPSPALLDEMIARLQERLDTEFGDRNGIKSKP